MPATAQAASKTGVTIDRARNSIMLVRELGVSPAAVFGAWTKPEHVACWWDPAGERLAECEIDLRLGGAFKFVSRGHPEMPFTGVYRQIEPPRQIEFDALGAKGRVDLQAVGAGTRMIVEIECASAEHLEQFLKMGVEVGTGQTLDNLVAYVRHSGAAVQPA